MEFPMMANNAGPGKSLTIHELLHTYFPMYVRINEKHFAWMDEGWADFIETLTVHKFFNDKKEDHSFYSKFKLGVQSNIGSISDLPAVTSSVYTTDNYGYQAYSLPSFTYALLYQHLGEKKILKCLKTYIERWAKKSPTPYDFFYTFENVSGEDLSFFWNSWYFKMGYPDLKIESFNEGNLIIKRIGERPVPISLKVAYDSINKKSLQNYSSILGADIWKNNNRTHTIKIPNFKKVESIVINSDFPDFNESDNFYPPLSHRYKKLNLDTTILGSYKLEKFPITLILTKKEGVLMFDLLNTGINSFLLPIDKNSFTSIDGTMTLKIIKEKEEKNKIELYLSSYNITLNGIQK
ncbi:M1 family aminopeptidase [Aquimarina aggregata]|uniref:M1 family aminopeptidase n=1 Tax=Aquimarina aggregata TaxID=1642818 RepID=UPI002491ECBF|nr:M1 family aminopeptidase [Aquimarina aggregata]